MDTGDWISVVAAIAAWAAVAPALYSAWYSKRALDMQRADEERRRPSLVPYLIDAKYRRAEGRRAYCFSLSVSNRSDSDNAVALVELILDYRRDDFPVSQVFPAVSGSASERPLQPPFIVSAHATVAGSVNFDVSSEVFRSAVVERYRLRLRDTHGGDVFLDTVLVMEVASEKGGAMDEGPCSEQSTR